jgi:predicted nucleic acid-binding protein
MKIIVDTDVWSEALRKKKGKESNYVLELRELINESRIQMIGPIRQEILSGLKDDAVFESLKKNLRSFPDLDLKYEVYEIAAKFFNLCRTKGIQGSNTDFLICACSVFYKLGIMTKDKDFQRYKKYLPIELIEPR